MSEQTIILRMDENGAVAYAIGDGEPVRVVIIEDDLIDESNITVDETECIAYEHFTHTDADRVQEILKDYD